MGNTMDGDDSDFYGNEQDVARLMTEVEAFGADAWWGHNSNQTQPIPSFTPRIKHEPKSSSTSTDSGSFAQKEEGNPINVKAENPDASLLTKLGSMSVKKEESMELDLNGQNPYDGVPYAWQLSESVESFLQRLPPSTTRRTEKTPWIYICNPRWKEPLIQQSKTPASDVRGCENEAPLPKNGSNLSTFIRGGMERLDITANLLQDLKKQNLPKQNKTRMMKSEQNLCSKDILTLAEAMNIRTGKWMLFPKESQVDEMWRTVATYVLKGELGIAAKVEPKSLSGGGVGRLICVYTYDFTDRRDIKRVLNKLREIGLIAGKLILWYKTDAYTYLGISSGNSWGLRASMLSSNDFLVED